MKPILPGSIIGIFGSGQLGRMLAYEARTMGYGVHTFSPDQNSPTGQIADREVVAQYEDIDAVKEFASKISVATFEFENVSICAAEAAESIIPVRPRGSVLHTTQHRIREKSFLRSNGFPVTTFAEINSVEDLKKAGATIGTPAIIKTASFGYDGKGQGTIRTLPDLEARCAQGVTTPLIYEKLVHFVSEVSVVGARGLDGTFSAWDVIENHHKDHILDYSVTPASVPSSVRQSAIDIARGIFQALDVVGVLCVEFFLLPDSTLLVNELAPRPHNSGHLTIEASVTSQFAQQLRAVCGLPLGPTTLRSPAAMVNLLGDLWENGEPHWERALALPNVHLHLYGKSTPRKGRKMGHITALGSTPNQALELACTARSCLAT